MTTISPIWKDRWEAIDKAIDILLERQLTFEMGSRRKATLDDLERRLRSAAG